MSRRSSRLRARQDDYQVAEAAARPGTVVTYRGVVIRGLFSNGAGQPPTWRSQSTTQTIVDHDLVKNEHLLMEMGVQLLRHGHPAATMTGFLVLYGPELTDKDVATQWANGIAAHQQTVTI